MRSILKWIGIVFGALVGLIIVILLGLYLVGNGRMARTYEIQPEAVVVPTEAAAIERGQRWASILCTGCHGEDLSGEILLNDSTLGYLPTPNLTPGAGGAGGEYTDADWVLALRHGVDPDGGRPLLGMPSASYYNMSDEDLGDLIAYLKSLPPVDNDLGEIRLTLMTKVLIAAGAFGEAALPAELIDHTGPRPEVPPRAATAEYGDYLVRVVGCRDCHGKELAGGKNAEPGAPPGTNITPGGGSGEWSAEDFIATTRSRQSEYMPWRELAQMTDDELKAVWLYLHSLPPMEDAIK